MHSRTGWGGKEWVGSYQPELARFFDFFFSIGMQNIKCSLLFFYQLFRGDSFQLLLKLLIFLPSLLPLPPTLIGLKTLCPEFALPPGHSVYGKSDSMATSGTSHTAAAGSPWSRI